MPGTGEHQVFVFGPEQVKVEMIFAASDAVLTDGKSPLPKFSGGFDFNVTYKKVMLSTQFSFKGGNYIYNLKKRDLLSGADGARQAQDVEALDYWQEPGDITDIPRLGAPVEAVTSDRFLEKGDFLRLRNVRLSYSLPIDLIEKLKRKTNRISCPLHMVFLA